MLASLIRSKALKRHLAIFNTTPCVVPFITGASIAMEEKFKKARENGEECDEESINAVKTALMGPLAGIGDSFFWGTLRIIAAGIGASLAAQGSILGAVLFFLMYNIPQLFVRYQGLKLGYKSGVSFLENMSQGGVIALLTEVAKILGLVVVGSMCASMVALSTPLVISMDGADVVIQDSTSQQKLCANVAAQIVAFACGKSDENRNKNFEGGRPSSIIIGEQLTPASLGALLAHFENKIMFQGFLWNVNSFDQEGVQLGKVLAKRVLAHDTDGALKVYSDLLNI